MSLSAVAQFFLRRGSKRSRHGGKMRRYLVFLWLVCFGFIVASTSQVQPKALSNDDVIQMVALGLSDDVIIEKIRSVSSTNFDTSVDGMKSLKTAKVSDAVLKAMINPHGSTSRISSVPAANEYDDKCSISPSAECREGFAGKLQLAIRKLIPDVKVHAVEDVIVFDSAKFKDQQWRTVIRGNIQKTTAMEQQLCSYGFKMVRFESSGAPASGPMSEDNLHCSSQLAGASQDSVPPTDRTKVVGQNVASTNKPAVAEDFPLRFTIIETHETGGRSNTWCWMTIRDADDMVYVVEEVTVLHLSCDAFNPGTTDIKGKQDKRWIDLVGFNEKGKVKVTRWEIKQRMKG